MLRLLFLAFCGHFKRQRSRRIVLRHLLVLAFVLLKSGGQIAPNMQPIGNAFVRSRLSHNRAHLCNGLLHAGHRLMIFVFLALYGLRRVVGVGVESKPHLVGLECLTERSYRHLLLLLMLLRLSSGHASEEPTSRPARVMPLRRIGVHHAIVRHH